MRILEEFWYGNVRPNENAFKRETQFDKLLRLLTVNESRLNALLNQEEKVVFEKYQSCQSELAQISECEIFYQGGSLRCSVSGGSHDGK